MDEDDPSAAHHDERASHERRLSEAVHERRTDDRKIVHFPGLAGAAIPQAAPRTYDAYREGLAANDPANLWAPFASKMEWEVANWAKMRGPTSTAFTELLQIEGLRDRLGLSFKSSKDLNNIIDCQLPAVPEFKSEEIVVDGETFEVFFRDVLECIKMLYSNPDFLQHMSFAPERHYADDDLTVRLYHQMHTGTWWWKIQKILEALNPGATVVPLILSTDKTQVTVFRNRSAYPVYMTIGNIAKEIRRKSSKHAQLLIGYLPTDGLLHIKNAETRRRALANLFHACMRRIMGVIKVHSRDGLPMATGDGVVRRCHPIVAAYVADYPEQALVACVKNGQCPKCQAPRDQLGLYQQFPTRDLAKTLRALRTVDRGPEIFIAACDEAGIKPVYHPFWEDLPHCNMFTSITPDVLHQMYQGMAKHILEWLKGAFGEAEMDERCKRLPRNHNTRLFSSGISHLSRVSGQEHKDICRILLGLIVDLPLPDGQSPVRLVRAVRALLDFLYLAQYPSHSDDTLKYLTSALERFHTNKHIFEELGIREQFNLPKLHSLIHYVESIRLFGTTDNYNTEATERLHIDYAKDAYRSTNHKDAFPQMTRWLVRREQLHRHANYVQWRIKQEPANAPEPEPAAAAPPSRVHIARFPNNKSVTFARLAAEYGAVDFQAALARYVVRERNPHLTERQVANVAEGINLPFRAVATYYTIKFTMPDPQGHEELADIRDAIHARPAYATARNHIVPGRFDTGLVNTGGGGEAEVNGYRVCQVRAVFSLPIKAREAAFPPNYNGPTHLAYIEWFTPFPLNEEPNHLMYKIGRSFRGARDSRRRVCEVIPVDDIRRSVHLFPLFGATVPRTWTSSNVLEQCERFYVSSFTDRHTYITIY
ncbi:hypothetical protein FA95DRAFT_1501909 [Auriscalpium vulgare]|uniref:Uncharacterized protein n=1 Tax=Auriscalpium vulgare TaxID=40419 RepID=A0ACB8RAJ3_9AGAM|nr:hypothetical protein FA95DRAFT_1501909 [Auriscalpium vulgare]